MAEPAPAVPAPPPAPRRRETVVAALLILCVAVVGFWEFMSTRSQRADAPLKVSAESFTGFRLELPGWTVRSIPLNPDPLEPNIIAYLVTPLGQAPEDRGILLRLVHGYNLVDCMRIKGEQVDLVADTRTAPGAVPVDYRPPPVVTAIPPDTQLWRLTSPTTRHSIWASAMLRADTLARTDTDTRSMPFPRIGTPDNPGWFPRGLTVASLRHPIENGRLFLRAKWNSSQSDLLTFLGLRRRAYVSDDLLTLVAASTSANVTPANESTFTREVLIVHAAAANALAAWSQPRLPAPGRAGVPPGSAP